VQIVLSRPESLPFDQYQTREESVTESPGEQNPASSIASTSAPDVTQSSQLVPPELALPVPESNLAPGVVSSPSLTGSRRTGERIPIAGDVGSFIAEEQSRLRANRPQGDATTVSLFGGQGAQGRSFIFLIDRSKSMGSEGLGALQAAEEELLRALQSLQPTHKFQIIAYHHQCAYLNRRELLPATEENKKMVAGFLGNLAAFGATEHELALQSALYHEPDVIYLLTDGGDPYLTEGQIRKITKLAGSQTAIHCIQFGFGVLQSDNNFLSRLAAMNRGSFTYINMSGRKP
jgi:hypothetical protein